MEFSDQQYYRALKAQDRRFDGRFFTCVTSTGIYCRPVCPAPTPKRGNCVFVRSAAEAEAAGFRACLRCRPETAPGSPAWLGTGATVKRGLRLIAETAAEGRSVEDLAERLGVGSRHLRRLFNEKLGASPKAIAQTERFAIARQLLVETDLPVAEVAHSAGFGSIRRFNDATRKAFGMPPSQLRRSRRTAASSRDFSEVKTPRIRLVLGYRPPYAWQAMLDYLRMRAIPGVEQVSSETYARTVRVDEVSGRMLVRNEAARNRLVVEFALDRQVVLGTAVQRVRDIFDLDASPTEIGEHLGGDSLLGPMVEKSPGLRVPGCWDMFELCLRAVIGQQISVRGAITLLGRMTRAFGQSIAENASETGEDSQQPARLFPSPADIAVSDLAGIGLTRARERTIVALAQAFVDDPAFIHPAMDVEEAQRRLLAIPGIGPWTANYITLRAVPDADAFPTADLGLLKAAGVDNGKALAAMAENWRPWRGYAVIYLWNSLADGT